MTWGEEASQTFSANAARRREQLFDDYTELIELGYSPLTACTRLDVKPANLMRTAYRWHRTDIATPLARLVEQDRRKP